MTTRLYLKETARTIINKYTIQEGDLESHVCFYCHRENGVNTDTMLSNIQLELGTTATPYTPYISDFTSIEVSRYGKNLFDVAIASIKGINISVVNNGEKIDFTALSDSNSKRIQILLPISLFTVGKQYILKMNATQKPNNIYVGNANSQSDTSTMKDFGEAGSLDILVPQVTFTVKNLNKPYVCIYMYFGQLLTNESGVITNIQLELGKTATEYEPFIEPQAETANAEGTVEGLTSLSPNMTLLTNTNGVVIDCQYYRDIDFYIDNQIADIALTGGV
jgi:hypothetical protein